MQFKRISALVILFSSLLIVRTIVQITSYEGRPSWLLSIDEIPDGWSFDSETEFSNRYFFSILSPSESIFSIETMEFYNASGAMEFVENEYHEWIKEGQLDYVFPNGKVNLSVADTGIVWEVKSSCCYSRGVLFSIDYIYVYIFGSQTSTWEEVRIIYTTQAIKILEFLDRNIPEELYKDLSTAESNSTNGFFTFASIISLLITVVYSKKRKK